MTGIADGMSYPTKVTVMASKKKTGDGEATADKGTLIATHGVFYTDGGCKPSRGVGGYGVHGYTFADVPAKQGTGCKNALPSRDGYIVGTTGIPDITLIQYIDAVGSLIPEATNNIAELMAAVKAFEIIATLDLKHVLILMDSAYTMDGLEKYLDRWIANDWVKADGQPVLNVEYWKLLGNAKRKVTEAGTVVEVRKVKGHSGDFGNDIVDAWASKGIAAGKNDIQVDEIIIQSAKGYWTSKTEINRMFAQPNWYFNSKLDPATPSEGYWTYHLGEPREDDELLGKKMVDASYSVLQMYQPEPVLELVRKAHAETDFLQYGTPVLGRLSEILSKDIYEDILQFGDSFLRRDFHNGMLVAVDPKDPLGTQLTRELRPPRLSFIAMESLELLEGVLKHHVRGNVGTRQLSNEITPILYETVLTGKKEALKLKGTITSAERALAVEIMYKKGDDSLGKTTISLTVGHDLPDRNTLAAISDQEPKVFVVAWPESEHAIRYATVVETTSGRGIWSAIYSNLHLVNP